MAQRKGAMGFLSESWNRVMQAENGSFRYWRVRTMYASIIGYAAFYLVRQNFSMAIPGICEEYGASKSDLGWIITAFSIIYGFGKLLNGYLSDRSDARIFMSVGLLLSAIVCFTVGFSSSIVMIGLLWTLNAYFQSMGWPPAARLLTHWFSPKELGTKWALWASSHQIGGVAITVIAGYLIVNYGWRSAFYVPAVMALLLSFFIYNRLRDTPKDVGLPPVEHYKGDLLKEEEANHDQRITMSEVIQLVIKNPLVWYISLANLCLYIPRMGVLNWAPTFLKEYKGATLLEAGWQSAAFEVAGLVGGILAGYVSDRFFGGRRGPVGALCLLGLAASMWLLWKIPAGHGLLDTVALILAGAFVYGPQVLAGIAIADFASKRAVGVATGFMGVLGYLGSAISGVGIGKIVDQHGWDYGFILFIITSLIGAFFFALTWGHGARILQEGRINRANAFEESEVFEDDEATPKTSKSKKNPNTAPDGSPQKA